MQGKGGDVNEVVKMGEIWGGGRGGGRLVVWEKRITRMYGVHLNVYNSTVYIFFLHGFFLYMC